MQGTSRTIARMVLTVTVSVAAVALGTVTAGAWGDVSRAAHLSTAPEAGHRGALVLITGSRFIPNQVVTISFVDANGSVQVASALANGRGKFTTWGCIPWHASPGADTLVALSPGGQALGWTTFRVIAPNSTSRTPTVASGKKGTARSPTLTSGQKSTARVPSLTSGKQSTARVPSLTSGKKGSARGTAAGAGGAQPMNICV